MSNILGVFRDFFFFFFLCYTEKHGVADCLFFFPLAHFPLTIYYYPWSTTLTPSNELHGRRIDSGTNLGGMPGSPNHHHLTQIYTTNLSYKDIMCIRSAILVGQGKRVRVLFCHVSICGFGFGLPTRRSRGARNQSGGTGRGQLLTTGLAEPCLWLENFGVREYSGVS